MESGSDEDGVSGDLFKKAPRDLIAVLLARVAHCGEDLVTGCSQLTLSYVLLYPDLLSSCQSFMVQHHRRCRAGISRSIDRVLTRFDVSRMCGIGFTASGFQLAQGATLLQQYWLAHSTFV